MGFFSFQAGLLDRLHTSWYKSCYSVTAVFKQWQTDNQSVCWPTIKKGLVTYFTLIGMFSDPRSSAFVTKYLLIMLSGSTLSRALWQSEQNNVVQLNTQHKHNQNKLLLYGRACYVRWGEEKLFLMTKKKWYGRKVWKWCSHTHTEFNITESESRDTVRQEMGY